MDLRSKFLIASIYKMDDVKIGGGWWVERKGLAEMSSSFVHTNCFNQVSIYAQRTVLLCFDYALLYLLFVVLLLNIDFFLHCIKFLTYCIIVDQIERFLVYLL